MLCGIIVEPAYAPPYIPPRPVPQPTQMVATAYSCSEREGTAGGITKSGAKVHEGIVAVDPELIPLGTEIYIEDMGLYIAGDTGQAIKGNRLDIYFNSYDDAILFGVKTINVWVQHPREVR